MNNNFKIVAIFILACFMSLVGCNSSNKETKVLEVIEKKNENSSIRITATIERRDFAQAVGGVVYVLEVSSDLDNNWREITTVYHDDGIQIDDSNIQFVNSKIWLVYVADTYAITYNSGKDWNLNNIIDKYPQCLINNIKLESDEKGKMLLKCGNKMEKINLKLEW